MISLLKLATYFVKNVEPKLIGPKSICSSLKQIFMQIKFFFPNIHVETSYFACQPIFSQGPFPLMNLGKKAFLSAKIVGGYD